MWRKEIYHEDNKDRGWKCKRLGEEEYLRVPGGLGGVGNSFFLHTKGLAQHLPFTPKKYQEFQGPQKYLKF